MKVLEPGAASVVLAEECPNRVLNGFPGSFFGHVFHQILNAALNHIRQRRALPGEVEAARGLGEAQIGVNARDDNARIHCDKLDPEERDAHVGIDHEALVEDDIENVSERARMRAVKITASRL